MRRLCLFTFLFALLASTSLASDSGHKDSYVLRDGDITFMLGEGMSSKALKQLQAAHGNLFLWARRNGRTWVFRDETTLDAARAAVGGNVPRAEQEKRLAAVVDAAIHRGAARPVARGEAYVFRDGDTRVTFSGGMAIEKIVAIQGKFAGDYLWVRRGGDDYLIRDEILLDRVRALFAPLRSIEPEQKAVGEEDAALDREEESLDDEADDDEAHQAHDDATRARLDAIHARQDDVGHREAELDRREEELERQAEAALWPLVDDAIRQGIAKRLR